MLGICLCMDIRGLIQDFFIEEENYSVQSEHALTRVLQSTYPMRGICINLKAAEAAQR